MCILTGTPERVSDTQILAFRAKDGRRQVTVYANRVSLRTRSTEFVPWGQPGGNNECAMVLPFPSGAGAAECEMIDTTGAPGLFKSLDGLFPTTYSMDGKAKCRGGGFGTLEVKSCGSYDYSVAPTLADLGRLDPALHIGDVAGLLGRNYPAGYSFLVCAIRESAKYHPIAYRHALRADGCLFLPTLHEHGPALHGEAMWDHAIYTLDAVPPPFCPFKEVDASAADVANAIGSALGNQLRASAGGRIRLCKATVKGDYPNTDTLVDCRD